MAGPRTMPSDLKNPVPSSAPPEAPSEPMPTPEETTPPPPPAPPAGAPEAQALPSDEEAQRMAQEQLAQGGGSPSGEDLTPEQAQALAQKELGWVDGKKPAAPSESLLAQGAGALAQSLMNPVLGALGHITQGKEASLGARLLSSFGKDPEAKAKIFSAQTGLETRLKGESVEFKRPGEDWRPVSPGYFKSLSSFIGSFAEHAPEALEAASSAIPAAAGAAVGTAAGLPTGPGAIGTGLVGGAAAGAAGGAMAALGRETVAKLLGADPDVALGQQVAMSAALGAAIPVVGKILRKPLQLATAAVIERVENSAAGKALRVGELTGKFEALYAELTGGSHPTLGQAGRLSEDAATAAEKKLGQQVGAVWDMAAERHPNAKFQLPETQRALEESLRDSGVQFIEQPRLTPSDPLRLRPDFTRVPSERLALAKRWGEIWSDLNESSGTTTDGLKRLYNTVKSESNYGSASFTPEQQAWRPLYASLRTDRGNVLTQAVAGTDLEAAAKSAFSEYADKIESLRALSKAAEKSPEKFAQSLFKDAETAKTAKAVLSNAADPGAEATSGWDAVRSAWLGQHYAGAKDLRTGIVDIPKFFDSVTKNKDLAEVVLGKDALGTLRGLSDVMSRTTWQGLLQNPDSVQSGAVAKGIAKLVLSGGHPGFAVSAISGMFGHDPKLLKLIQEKGILRYAAEAKSPAERSVWLRASEMINRVLNATQVKLPIAGMSEHTFDLPIESAMIPVLLNAGVRPHGESAPAQRQAMADGYQTFLEHAQAKAHENALALEQARLAQGAQMPQAINPLAYARGGASRFRVGHIRR